MMSCRSPLLCNSLLEEKRNVPYSKERRPLSLHKNVIHNRNEGNYWLQCSAPAPEGDTERRRLSKTRMRKKEAAMVNTVQLLRRYNPIHPELKSILPNDQ